MDQTITPFISVILPVYNGERYLGEAVKSILNQTFDNFELIIIDDGSTDRTKEIILAFSDPRIHYVKNDKNHGLIYSLNKGLELAKGKYIARMDADDISLNDRFEKQIDFLENHPEYGIVGGQMKMIGDASGIFAYPVNDEIIRVGLLSSSAFAHPAVMFRTALIKNYKIRYDEQFVHSEDYKFWVDLIKYTKGYNLPTTLFEYRIHKDSISSNYINIQRDNRNKIRKLAFFQLLGIDKKTIESFFGNNYNKKIFAYRSILLNNYLTNRLNDELLEKKLKEILYKDALEMNNSIDTYYKFPLLFKVFKFEIIILYTNLFKHRLKYLINK